MLCCLMRRTSVQKGALGHKMAADCQLVHMPLEKEPETVTRLARWLIRTEQWQLDVVS